MISFTKIKNTVYIWQIKKEKEKHQPLYGCVKSTSNVSGVCNQTLNWHGIAFDVDGN